MNDDNVTAAKEK